MLGRAIKKRTVPTIMMPSGAGTRTERRADHVAYIYSVTCLYHDAIHPSSPIPCSVTHHVAYAQIMPPRPSRGTRGEAGSAGGEIELCSQARPVRRPRPDRQVCPCTACLLGTATARMIATACCRSDETPVERRRQRAHEDKRASLGGIAV